MGGLRIFIEAQTSTLITLNEIIHLRVSKASTKGFQALLAEPLWLWPG